jgi:hypothetical protein
MTDDNIVENEWFEKIVKDCDYDTRLAITAWVFKHINEQAKEGGTYRYLIYDRLGFNMDAYVPLWEVGGIELSNMLFDARKKEEIVEIVRENKIEALKSVLYLCDEPGCFKDVSCGYQTKNGYRSTCFDHNKTE